MAGEIEFLSSTARSNKLHADKAASDAKTYCDLLLQTEARLNEFSQTKQRLEHEVMQLKSGYANIN
jgi:phage shock protein A